MALAQQSRVPSKHSGDYRELVSVLESQWTEADASVFEVGEQREQNYRNYTLQRLGNEVPGKSQYISPDVLDVVEAKKAYFSRTFLSARQTVKFKPTHDANQQEADKRTSYVSLQLKKNKFFATLRDFWHDAFVAKRGVYLVEWEQDEEEYLQQVPGVPLAQIQQAITQDPRIVDVVDQQLQVQPTPQGPIAKGSLTLIRDTSRIKITLCQPERYYRDPNVSYVCDGAYAGYDEDTTRTELINRGYDPDQVSGLQAEYRWQRDEEDTSRKAHDSSWTRRRLHNRPKATEEVSLIRTWTWLDMSQYVGDDKRSEPIDTDKLGLYEIHWANGEILHWADGSLCIREVSEIPFFEWSEFKISHAEHGMAVADVVGSSQRANSVLKRLIIDNQQQRNTSRYEAVTNAIKNPRELLDNHIGGVIWSRRIGSVQPLATPELSPLTFQTLEMLSQDKEERGGISRLAQGLNQDAVSNQNADRMIERLTGLGNERNARAARDFAETLMVPLMQYVYRLGVRNDEQQYMVEAQGNWHNIKPMAWEDEDWDMEVHVALTPEESQRHAQSLLMMHQVQSQDPQLAPLYQMPQRYALFDSIYDSLGITDSSQFLMRPDDPRVQQQMQQQQQMMMQQQQEMKMLQMQTMRFQMWLQQSDEGRKWYEAQLKGGKLQLETADKATDNQREDDKFAHTKLLDWAEYKLERDQKRPAALGGN